MGPPGNTSPPLPLGRVSVILWNLNFTHELERENTCRSLGTNWVKAILAQQRAVRPISQVGKCGLGRSNKEWVSLP